MKKTTVKDRKLKKVAKEVAKVAEYLWINGWAERNAGNISVNVTGIIDRKSVDHGPYQALPLPRTLPELAGMCFFMTGTGKRMRDMADKPFRNAVLTQINQEGNTLCLIPMSKHVKKDVQPTSELTTHLGIHQMIARRQSGERAVIHTHPTELIALSQSPAIKTRDALNKLLWGMHPETMVFIPGGVGFVPYVLPGTTDIATPTISELEHHDIVLWEKHGAFAVGRTLSDAFDIIDIACKSARIWFLCKSAGFDPEGLSGKQLAELKELVKKFHL
ncbi:MAG TPA: rhamnulose-1-phosphate aldolase [Bacteroidales bacterium]|nr:rhamnulose-1-phosphate aldolase [Bacteroidales bacterium]HNS46437.1 rhamnulose-1-phosphate aldolase [Bacteroidales bacterium]